MDMWILGFIHLTEGIDYPFAYGDQSLFKLFLISSIFKQSGTFKQSVLSNPDELFKTVLNAYLSTLLKNDQLVEVFLETKRSRSGKISHPSEVMFEKLLNVYIKENELTKKDLLLVPVTINYDRVIEGEIFHLDLLGETSNTTLSQVVKHLTNVKKQQGKVIVRYCEPISFKNFSETYLQKNGLSIEAVKSDQK